MVIHNPSALLERLLQEPTESPWLEFKENNAVPDEIGSYVSALANGAMLAGKDRAFLVFGVENGSKLPVGTQVRLTREKKGGEPLEAWLGRMLDPRLLLEFLDFEYRDKHFAIIAIEPSYERPVKFAGTEYIRIGESKRKLAEYPERERALWLATSRRKFEDAVAAPNATADDVLEWLDDAPLYDLAKEPRPQSIDARIRNLLARGFLIDNLEGRYDITNLGAIMIARDIGRFASIAGKAVRVIKYTDRDKARSEFEIEGKLGYALGFARLMRVLMQRLPTEERYESGIRRTVPIYPEVSIRETIANALIHQDFTVAGAGPTVEIYENRIEISNPGNSLIEPDRLLDERRSRNEKLARTMRDFGLCEERGGGLDKTLIEIERAHLPAPEFLSSERSMRVVLFGPRAFAKMSKADKMRACFYHCVLRWLSHEYMSNSSLRDRFSLPQESYQAISVLIADCVKAGRIVAADPEQGKRNAKYIPYWAGPGV